MTQAIHKEPTRGWALVAQQLAVAIEARRREVVRPVAPGRWYPGGPSIGARKLETAA